ncbi:hypothetical protein U9M48_029057, partial [Paspalum notatum var. saurae]
ADQPPAAHPSRAAIRAVRSAPPPAAALQRGAPGLHGGAPGAAACTQRGPRPAAKPGASGLHGAHPARHPSACAASAFTAMHDHPTLRPPDSARRSRPWPCVPWPVVLRGSRDRRCRTCVRPVPRPPLDITVTPPTRSSRNWLIRFLQYSRHRPPLPLLPTADKEIHGGWEGICIKDSLFSSFRSPGVNISYLPFIDLLGFWSKKSCLLMAPCIGALFRILDKLMLIN